MSEYIKREDVMPAVEWALELYPSEYADVRSQIDDIPAADVVEVIRCKDCKYWRDWQRAVASHGFGENMGQCHCPQWENEYFYYLTKDIDFCSYGERMEDFNG